ncbi:protein FAM32A-like [Iris pallida]|uniref:Protein FAM32A-like n=1 Tax=Iris pallida TaxID=29817 RepID=A0AAX6FZ61_IRIPA|nr:protein FAM32A-like [Iris pallida]KAJ6825645.1 protein FAM32A-like [Iris pallida]
MSAYENVVGGKLKLKGKALNVAGGVKKKKKHKHHHHDDNSQIRRDELQEGGSSELPTDPTKEITNADKVEDEDHPSLDGDQLDGDQMTPAERRYIEQRERIDMRRLAKTANKSHRDRIEDFNQYLANLSEHYDIPKVGPG